MDHRRFLKPAATIIVLVLFGSVASVSLSLPAFAGATSPTQSNQRVLIKGTRFVLEDGSPFVFLGGNLAFYRFVVQRGEIYSKTQVDEIVRNLATYTGAKMMRVGLAGGAFEPTLGNYSETTFQQLDYVMAAAKMNEIRVIVALRDYAWTPWPRDQKDPYWLLGGGTLSNPNKDAIILDSQAKEAYKRFISYVLERMNSITGLSYKDDPTIFAWDLLNDANFSPKNDPELLRSWVIEIGTFVRSIDKTHFLTLDFSGDQDWWDPGEQNWRVFTNNLLIDYISMHYYAPPKLYDPVDTANVARIKTRVETGLKLGKPVVLDEFGVEGTGLLKTRVNLYRTVIETILRNGGSGALFWCWGPLGPNGWGGISNSGGWDVYVNQRKDLADVVLAEAILWTGYKPVTATTTTILTTTLTLTTTATSTQVRTVIELGNQEEVIIYALVAVSVSFVVIATYVIRKKRSKPILARQQN